MKPLTKKGRKQIWRKNGGLKCESKRFVLCSGRDRRLFLRRRCTANPATPNISRILKMHAATSKMARLASTYASHVPFPASAQTSGIVATGVVVGAMVEMDCASVSIGESTSRRNPYVELWGGICDA
jgi:hypothetical protein